MKSVRSKVWATGPRRTRALLISCPLAAATLIACPFSTGCMDQSRVVTIPAGTVLSRPSDESGTSYLGEPVHARQSVSLENGICRTPMPQPKETPRRMPNAGIAADDSAYAWAGVATYIADRVGNSWVAGVDFASPAHGRFVQGSAISRTSGFYVVNVVWCRHLIDNNAGGSQMRTRLATVHVFASILPAFPAVVTCRGLWIVSTAGDCPEQ